MGDAEIWAMMYILASLQYMWWNESNIYEKPKEQYMRAVEVTGLDIKLIIHHQ